MNVELATVAETVDLLADAIADRLEARYLDRSSWVNAEVVAAHLSVHPEYVYEHAAELGARRLGSGPKARLRFKLDLVDAALCVAGRESAPSEPAPLSQARRRRRAKAATAAQLLPIRGVR